jgi:hypothetical protein
MMAESWDSEERKKEVVRIMANQFELRLLGADAPDGEVSLTTLANLAATLQELNRRIGRDLLASSSAGRTPEVVASLTDMRLAGLTAGSTRLHFARGRSDELDLDLEVDAEIDSRFWQIVGGIATNVRPGWVTDPIADSAKKFGAALAESAPQVELRKFGEEPIKVVAATLNTDVWQEDTATTARSEVVYTGRLEAVDLRSGRFRIVDDVGNRLTLEQVSDPQTVAYLINHRVRAMGVGTLDSTGRLKRIDSPSLGAQVFPASWTEYKPADLSAELSKPGPTFGGGADLTDAEYDEFIATIRGQ